MSKLTWPIPDNVLSFLSARLVRQVRKAVLDKIVEEKLAEVEHELRARLQPEVEKLTIEMISAANNFFNDRINLLVAWNHEIVREEKLDS